MTGVGIGSTQTAGADTIAARRAQDDSMGCGEDGGVMVVLFETHGMRVLPRRNSLQVPRGRTN